MIGKMLQGMPELVEVMRWRRETLGISFETLDQISGVNDRYSAKVLSPNPLRGLGYMSTGALLGGLGLSFIVVENPQQIGRVQHLWIPRKRPQRLETGAFGPSALLAESSSVISGATPEVDQ